MSSIDPRGIAKAGPESQQQQDGRVPDFRSIDRTNRSTQVRDQLENAIAAGELKPGQRLPSERELAETFGVSRVSVREALRSLEALGMIVVAAGRGCFVADTDKDGFAAPFRHWLSIHRDEVIELLKVRGALDALAAEEAARTADTPALERLIAAQQAFETALTSGSPLRQLVELDLGFHDTITRLSGSQLLTKLVGELNEYVSQARMVTLSARERAEKSVVEHRAIVEAIVSHDAQRARDAAARHVQSTRASVHEMTDTASVKENSVARLIS